MLEAKKHENSHSCDKEPASPGKTWTDRLAEFATFTEKGKRELEKKHQSETQALMDESRKLCAQLLRERADHDFISVSLRNMASKGVAVIDPESALWWMLGLNQKQVRESHGSWKSEVDRKTFPHIKPGDKRYAELRKRKGEAIDLTIDTDAKINFRTALDEQWKKKMEKYKNRAGYPEIEEFYRKTIIPYVEGRANFHPISLENYAKKVDIAIMDARKKIGNRMEEWFSKYGIPAGSPRAKLAMRLEKLVGTPDLIGLSMTELLGKDRGSNMAIFKTFLEKGGEEYLLLLPSMNDSILSYGPYQHTKYSINLEDAGGKMGWARMADMKFSAGAILSPGDIGNLPLSEQHAAAYLLTLQNIATLVRNIPDEILIKKEIPAPKWSKKKGSGRVIGKKDSIQACLNLLAHPKSKEGIEFHNAFVGFIAGAHNSPQATYSGFNRWLEASVGGKQQKVNPSWIDKFIPNAPTAVANAANQSNHKEVKKDEKGDLKTVVWNREKIALIAFAEYKL